MTCTVSALLRDNCSSKPVDNDKAPPPAQDPSSTTTDPSTSNPQPQTDPEPVTGPTVNESPEPLDLNEAMRGELSAVTPAPRVVMNQYQYPAHVLSLIKSGGGGSTGVLGTQTDRSVLEATDQGWRFLGLLWYWWVIMIGGIVGLAALIKTTVTNSFSRIVRQP